MLIYSIINITLGALSFLMLLPGAFFWFGFAFAAISLIMGTMSKKSPLKSRQICGFVGIALSVLGALSYIIIMYFAGFRYVEIL